MNRKSEEMEMINTEVTVQELQYAYWLCNIRSLGKNTVRQLLQEAGSAQAVWQLPGTEAEKLMKPSQYRFFAASRAVWNVEKEYNILESCGIRFIPQMHPEFPERLRQIPDAPVCLYVKGRLPDSARPSVAIIGARMCSEYGRYLAREFGMELAGAGIQIISGMAGGVDGISQKGAILAGGTSYAVMGCGVDCCYPLENRELYDMLPENGGIISEYAPGTQPKANLFPPRNRIISGLADLVLVIEARKHSGTLITVDMALEQGREVWAVPGRITDRLSDGCNQLIRQGAGIALSPEDLLQEFYGIEKADSETQAKPVLKLTPMENALLGVLDLNLQTISQLYDKMTGAGIQTGIPELMNELVQLCIKGMAEQEGSCFRKKR